jgi:hypothetical protein
MTLAGCGSGGEEPIALSEAPATLSGVAATGAALAGAAVEVRDSSGSLVCATSTDGAGAYTCTLEKSAAAPFAVTAVLDDHMLVSVASEAVSGTVNVTPLTTLVAARLTPSGNPAELAEALRRDPGIATRDKVQAKVEELRKLLAPLLSSVGDVIDPISGRFAADGTGHDKVLDALNVSIRPEAGWSNIEITVKARPTDDAQPPVSVIFRSNVAQAPVLTAPIRAEDLPADRVADLATDFIRRAGACYALPLAERIADVNADATSAVGGAAAVAAQACRTLFVNDDPATYKDNGAVVGHAGAFRALFSEGGTGVVFDRPNVEYQLANGDIFLTFRSTSKTGAVNAQTQVVRKQGSVLKAIGNQYEYEASVRPFAAARDFLFQPAYSWFGSGYNVSIANRLDPATQLPLFSEVRVTAPNGATSVYRPSAGRSALTIAWPDGVNRSNQVQFIASAYQDTATAGMPSEVDGAATRGGYFTPQQRTDDEMRQIPDQGVWTLEWVHANSSTPPVVQTYRTLSRALTIGETRKLGIALLSGEFKSELLADTSIASSNGIVFAEPSATTPSVFHLGASAGGPGWTVPDPVLAPVSISLFGLEPATGSFNDTLGVATTARSGTIKCQPKSADDFHCDSSTGVRQFAQGARITTFELWTKTLKQVEVQRQTNLYKVAPPAN